MNKKLGVFLIALGAIASSPAMAQTYLGAGIGASSFTKVCEGWSAPGESCDNKDIGFKLVGGYKFNPYFALEAAYVNLGKATESWQSPSWPGNDGSGKLKSSGLGVWALGSLPINDFEIFGKAGIAFLKTKYNYYETYPGSDPYTESASESATSVALGIGAAYNFTPKFSARIEWERFRAKLFTENINMDLISTSVIYRF